jgi:hypothetical protein
MEIYYNHVPSIAGINDPTADPKGLAREQSVIDISRSSTLNQVAAIRAGIFK